ncbi:hypothetical protein CCMA1212_002131 [Trichoderma ghanense]|uniref:Uncharacterized protein n=1 Tax=Trichoderma ghanense TaxID=65468 RepID=A0ABY2HF67_9HYPO
MAPLGGRLLHGKENGTNGGDAASESDDGDKARRGYAEQTKLGLCSVGQTPRSMAESWVGVAGAIRGT